MKYLRLILIVILAGLLLNLSPSEVVTAQMFSSYVSSVTVQNLSDADADVNLTYYFGGDHTDAGDPAEQLNEIIGPYEVVEYATIPVGSFEGSLVISSSTPLGAVSVLNGDNKGRGMYTGMTSGSTKVVLPFMMNNWGASRWNTYFSVQNIDPDEPATVDINYAYCPNAIDNTVTIEPNSMKIIDQADEPCLSGQGRVITSAILTSNKPIVVVVSQESTIVKSALVSNGYSRGSAFPVIPLVNANNPTKNDWRTAISIFNLNQTLNTEVTLHYVRKDGFECEETRTILANSATEFGGNAFILGSPNLTCPTGERFIGAAYVTGNTNSVDLVATVNQDRGTLASSYSSFNMEDGTPRIAFPRFVNQFGGSEDWDSTFTVMNVGSTNIYVKCDYLNASYSSTLGTIEPFGVREDLPRYDLPVNYSGGGICTAYSDSAYTTIDHNAKIIGIVNTRGHGTGYNDLMMTYEAVNVELEPIENN